VPWKEPECMWDDFGFVLLLLGVAVFEFLEATKKNIKKNSEVFSIFF
jgi:hypothetical protein